MDITELAFTHNKITDCLTLKYHENNQLFCHSRCLAPKDFKLKYPIKPPVICLL